MVVCAPVASVYAEPCFSSQQTDEILYGEKAELLQKYNGFCKIKTDYGYIGFVAENCLCSNDYKPNYIVISHFCDLLPEPKFYYNPLHTLPFGSQIKIVDISENARFAIAEAPNGDKLYIHKSHISPIKTAKIKESVFRPSVTETAKKFLGVQYRWGGRTPKGIDCSGLCFNSYRYNGVTIWRDADITRSDNLREIPMSQIKPGDLLFFKGHIAMYLGNGEIIHSSASSGKVVCEKWEKNPYLKEIFICVGTLF